MHLKNKMGEKEACDNALRLINNKEYVQSSLSTSSNLSYDILYKP